MSAIDQAISRAGGVSALAKLLGTSPQVVCNWRRRGIPAERVLAVEQATEGEVTRYDLRPDLYPRQAVRQ